LTDQLLDDEFPLSMFYEALERKMSPVIEIDRRHPRLELRHGQTARHRVARISIR